MTPLQAVIVGFVFVSFLQDSFEADFTSVPDMKAASDIKVFLKRRAICKSLCRSKSQDITHFEKVRKDVKIWVCVFSMCIWRLVYSIIIFSFDKLSLCIEHTRLLRSQAENEIFYTLNIFNSSATSILNLQYDDIDFMFFHILTRGYSIVLRTMTGSVSQTRLLIPFRRYDF